MQAEEEAWMQEEERHAWEEECRVREEEYCAREEEEQVVVERDLREEEGPSWERAPWRRLSLPSLDSAGSPEEEERVKGPSKDKVKGQASVSEEVRGGGHRGRLRPL